MLYINYISIISWKISYCGHFQQAEPPLAPSSPSDNTRAKLFALVSSSCSRYLSGHGGSDVCVQGVPNGVILPGPVALGRHSMHRE